MILRFPPSRAFSTLPTLRSHQGYRSRNNYRDPSHYDLPSFLAHAQRVSLPSKASVYIGTYYEYLCASALRRLSFNLSRSGGANDRGIDLYGTWQVPCLQYPLRVLVQCKARKEARIGPDAVRELEGAVAGAPDGWRLPSTIGVLCGKQPATNGVREAVKKSGTPILWIMVEEHAEAKHVGRVRQVLWNERVDELGLQDMSVGLKHVEGQDEGMEKAAVLLWNNELWEPGLEAEEYSGLVSSLGSQPAV